MYHFEKNSRAFFNILTKPLLVQKQMIHQQKARDLSYLQPKGQRRGIIMGLLPCHRRQKLKNPLRPPMLFATLFTD